MEATQRGGAPDDGSCAESGAAQTRSLLARCARWTHEVDDLDLTISPHISHISPLYLPYISPLSSSSKDAISPFCRGLRSQLGLSLVQVDKAQPSDGSP